jgi:hypothetical protein
MREKSFRELISAYFDGELTPDEVQAAEQLLERDAGARRFLEELESLRGCLSDLPQARMSSDLSHRVLQEAERRMLKGPASNGSTPSHGSDDQGFVARLWLKAGLAMAIAASLLAAFFLSGRDDPVANHTKVAARSQPPASGAANSPESALSDLNGQDAKDFDVDGSLPTGGMGGFAGKAAAEAETGGRLAKLPAETAETEPLRKGMAAPQSMDDPVQLTVESANSYVLDVPSDVAQTRVLAQFEQVLNEQQIALEHNGAIAEPAPKPNAVAGADPSTSEPGEQLERKAIQLQQAVAQNADRVYVIEATAEQLSNTIVGLNRLANESPMPVRLRKLGASDNTNLSLFYSAAGEMTGGYGADRMQFGANGVAAIEPAPAAAGQVAGGASQRSNQGQSSAPSARKSAEPQARFESGKSVQQADSSEARQQKMQLPLRELREPALVREELQAQRVGQQPLPSVATTNANLANEMQQRAVFIFRVVPPQLPANPAPAPATPAAEPAKQ